MAADETEFLAAAEQAARVGGDVLSRWSERFTVSEKGPADLVTEADFASQEAIHDLLGRRYPGHRFLGEEGLCESGGDSPYRWLIDPLDGTSNYVHQFPYYAVSVALERAGELLAGAIFDPSRAEMFTAARGRGASLNGRPIGVSAVESLRGAMLVASLPVDARRDDPAVERFLRVLADAQTVQRTGSAALNLAYVASGRIDGFWSTSLKPWDMAAGVLLVREAGGCVSKLDGFRFEVEVPDLLASNGSALHGALQGLLA